LNPDTVTHSSTNRARRRVTSLIWPTSLPTAPNRYEHDVVVRVLIESRHLAVSCMRNGKCAIWPLLMAESPKFLHLIANRGRRTRWWRQIFDRKYIFGRFAHAQWKICHLAFTYGRIVTIPEAYSKSGSGNMMVTSDVWPEVEIWPFRACTA